MASAAHAPYLTVEEYLRTTFRPDVDYVDGQIEERNLGEFDHSTLQYQLARYFDDHRHEWKLRFAIETRVQTGARRFRVPDVCVMDAAGPKEQIIRSAPMLCIEILSPEDTLRKMLLRVGDYFAMGVPWVWIFDPSERVVVVCEAGGGSVEQRGGLLTPPGTLIAVPIEEIFSALDAE
jgi:Uma2 family endonuclease